MKRVTLFFIWIYQKFFTLLSFGSCRYYPTCSEYAKWQILHNGLFKAFFYSFLRVLRCNQLFRGGIDYPVITKDIGKNFKSITNTPKTSPVNVKFWFVPKNKKSFYILKAF